MYLVLYFTIEKRNAPTAWEKNCKTIETRFRDQFLIYTSKIIRERFNFMHIKYMYVKHKSIITDAEISTFGDICRL